MLEETLIPLVRAAGGLQIAILAANAALPRRLDLRANLARLSPIMAAVLLVHWGYILLVLALFSTLCLLFAPELAGGSAMGRFLSASLAVFWGSRVVVQLTCYGPSLRRRHPIGHAAFAIAALALAAIFTVAAIGPSL